MGKKDRMVSNKAALQAQVFEMNRYFRRLGVYTTPNPRRTEAAILAWKMEKVARGEAILYCSDEARQRGEAHMELLLSL